MEIRSPMLFLANSLANRELRKDPKGSVQRLGLRTTNNCLQHILGAPTHGQYGSMVMPAALIRVLRLSAVISRPSSWRIRAA